MEKKYNRQGVIGTVIFHILILLLLIFFGLTTLPQEEEGILVNLGNVQTGLGPTEPQQSNNQPSTPPEPVKTSPPKTEASSTPKTEEAVKTQDFDEAPEIKSAEQLKKEKEEKLKKQQQEEEERRIKEEADRKAKAEAEAKRKAELERQRKLEEERKKREEQKRIADEARNKVGSAFGKSNNNSSSEGDAGGKGNQGYTTGDPNSKNRSGSGLGNTGTGFSLNGRSLVGSLPQPNYNIQEEGVVVVQITVNKYGQVVSAEYQLRGSTTQNSVLKRAAIEAAKKAKFNSDPKAAAFQKGTITYTYELN